MRKALAAILLAALLPVCPAARAVPRTPYPAETVLRYALLTPAQQSVLDLLYAAASAGLERAELPPGTRYADVTAAFSALADDYPELCSLSGTYTVGYKQRTPEVADYVSLTYTRPPGERAAAERALLTAARDIAGRAEGGPYERALFLHDTLCGAAAYGQGDAAYSAYGALVAGTAVCQGYAEAFSLLCRLSGIPCSVITGTARDEDGVETEHAWNLCDLSGVRCLTDPTWNDQPDGLSHVYFNLTDAQMSRDHRADPGQGSETAVSDALEWYRLHGFAAAGEEEADAVFLRQAAAMAAGRTDAIFLRLPDQPALERMITGWQALAEEAGIPLYGAFALRWCSAQACLTIRRQEDAP